MLVPALTIDIRFGDMPVFARNLPAGAKNSSYRLRKFLDFLESTIGFPLHFNS